jgi:hypothetical protein
MGSDQTCSYNSSRVTRVVFVGIPKSVASGTYGLPPDHGKRQAKVAAIVRRCRAQKTVETARGLTPKSIDKVYH